jgi:signal transduction histidine kinase
VFLFPSFSVYYVRLSVRHMTKTGKSDRGHDLRLPGLVHDLNNVFQTLLDAADLLQSDAKSAEYVAAAILRCVERGRKLAASMESAEGEGALLESILKDAISFVQDSQGALTKVSKIRFTQSIERGIELRRNWAWDRVLINLFSNAVRAMPDGGTIHVSARRIPAGVEIVVRDEGPGIAPALLKNIFKAHVSTKGSGLGLHIVETIVKQDGGEIRAANREDGRGAEFTMVIPDQSEKLVGAAAHAMKARA